VGILLWKLSLRLRATTPASKAHGSMTLAPPGRRRQCRVMLRFRPFPGREIVANRGLLRSGRGLLSVPQRSPLRVPLTYPSTAKTVIRNLGQREEDRRQARSGRASRRRLPRQMTDPVCIHHPPAPLEGRRRPLAHLPPRRRSRPRRLASCPSRTCQEGIPLLLPYRNI
jgi:hypothetical protein